MIVHVIESGQMFSCILPLKVKGQYWLNDLDKGKRARALLGIEAIEGRWTVKSNRNVSIMLDNKELSGRIALDPMSFYELEIKGSDTPAILFSEEMDVSRQSFQKIQMKEETELMIGRDASNHICYSNKYVSSEHAKLIYKENSWMIEDIESTNGTYVNGWRIEKKRLLPGDMIFIMGLRIVIGSDFFSINNPDEQLKVRSTSLHEYTPQVYTAVAKEINEIEKEYFYRSPYFGRESVATQISIDPPPQHQKIDSVPLALMLGPSLTMAMTSLATGVLSIYNVMRNGGDLLQVSPTLMMSVSMLMGAVLWPLLTKRHEKKLKIKEEQKRQEKYLIYLNEIRDDIKRQCHIQKRILLEKLISPEECQNRIFKRTTNLWERNIGHKDFLTLRVGLGELPLQAEIECQNKKFTMEDDNLQNAMLALKAEPKMLVDAPVSISLVEDWISGVYGERCAVRSLMKSLILQMVALHSYDELKILLITDEDEPEEWEFVRWLPHCWSNDKKVRFYAVGELEIKELSAYIEKNIVEKEETEGKNNIDITPYYVVLITSKKARDSFDVLRRMMQFPQNKGFSVVLAAEAWKDVPKEAKLVVAAKEKESRVFRKNDINEAGVLFAQDDIQSIDMRQLAEAVANIELDMAANHYKLPDMLGFLQMFHVGKIEHLNILTRWSENNPVKTLRTLVGVDAGGNDFYLDLHEKYHGPHGLVAGMTGSGKSEFILTYILSLAVNYHPDEVAFILIDYKGGGLAGAFEDKENGIKLPHLAGTITNLDGSSIKRSLISIQSELRRRQAVFNEARKISNEGTMDIYKYQQLYREKIVAEPIPHLFIISDEFAELKTQQPEFMEQLISAARIGRSLGVHLILATQKPSGVVDDQIWSNSKFRVCLKVQERADSQDMIKCADAAELTQTGRFYLQVGFNELFALGQSAWSGAEYVPVDVVETKKDSYLQIIDNLGRVMIKAEPKKKREDTGKKTKQIVAIIKYLSELAEEENISVKSLWLDPIPACVYVDQLEKKYAVHNGGITLNPVIGELDDPFNQRQEVLQLPISEEGNCLVYGAAGSGKTTFLTTLCYCLIKDHTAEEVNLYILDYGAETLKVFDAAPQVGGVLTGVDEEKTIRLFQMLQEEMESRKRLFSEYGGDYASYCRRSGSIIPNIVVVINNFSGFSDQYEDLLDAFALLSRDGIKYGIYFVVTAGSTNAVRYSLIQNFRLVFCMQLNDAMDYSIVVGRTEGLVPAKVKGRGLVNRGKVYEYQTAYCADVSDMYGFLRAYVCKLIDGAKGHAKKIPFLPDVVSMDHIRQDVVEIPELPIGINKKNLKLASINMRERVVYPIVTQDVRLVSEVVEGLTQSIGHYGDAVVLDAEHIVGKQANTDIRIISSDLETTVRAIFSEMAERNNAYVDAGRDVDVLSRYTEQNYLIIGMKKLQDQLSPDGRDKLNVLLENGEFIYKMHFIILDSVGSYGLLAYDSWYKRHITGSDGLWIGNGVTDQNILKLNKISSDLYESLEDWDGYQIDRGRPVSVRVISSGIEEEN